MSAQNNFENISNLAKRLAANEENVRYKAYKKLKENFTKDLFATEHFQYLWNGLFFMYWHSDTMEKQSFLSKDIVTIAVKEEHFLEWMKAGFLIMRRQWSKLDYHRTSKFMNLVSSMLSAIFKFIEAKKFSKKIFTEWNTIFSDTILDESVTEKGLMLYIVQIYPSTSLSISYRNVVEFFFTFKPIFDILCFTTNKILRHQIKEKVTTNLIEFISLKLTKEARDFFRSKLMGYAMNEKTSQPGRNCFYIIIEELDAQLKTSGGGSSLPSDQLIGMKKGPKKQVTSAAVSQKAAAKESKKQLQKKVKKAKKSPTVAQLARQGDVEGESDYGLVKKGSGEIKFDPGMLEGEDSEIWEQLDDDIKQILLQNENGELTDEHFDIEEDELENLLAMQDDYNAMNYEDMRKRLPKYYFMSPKQKKKYFRKLTRDYLQKMNQNVKKGIRRLKFNIPGIKIKKFKKTLPPSSAVGGKQEVPVNAQPNMPKPILKK